MTDPHETFPHTPGGSFGAPSGAEGLGPDLAAEPSDLPGGSGGSASTATSGGAAGLKTPFAQKTVDAVDRFGETAEQAVRAARERITPAVVRLASQAEALTLKGSSAARDGSEQLRARAASLRERSAAYVRAEPLKASVIAVATGAVLMALLRRR